MIASLKGILQYKSSGRLIVEVAGVGYDVAFCREGMSRLPETGGEIFLHIYTNVREDAIALYGFLEVEARELFVVLLGVSGVGPKLALNILSAAAPAQLARAIMSDDLAALVKLPGVGKKTAERLCLELKDKVRDFADLSADETPASAEKSPGSETSQDVISALVNLGYPAAQAEKALKKVVAGRPAGEPEPPIEEILRLTLRSLA